MEFNTRLLHGDGRKRYQDGATVPPIAQVSAFAYDQAEDLEKIFNNRAPGFAYTRISNPTVDAFERRIAGLEQGKGAIACSSGMSAITLSLLNILRAGDEIIAGSGLFGGTIDLFSDMEEFGITTRFVHHVTAEEVEPLINDKTKVIFGEIIGNPGLDIMDIRSVSNLAHSHGIPLIVDGTTATPYLLRPFEYGADIVIHSSSKYINGGGNSVSGIIIDSGKFPWDYDKYEQLKPYQKYGEFAYLAKLRNGIWRNMGVCLSPMNAFMNLVGLESLGLRMERICSNARQLAAALEALEGISVNYPGLPGNPYARLVQSQLGGKAGGILTLRAGSRERAYRLMNHLKYACNATNIGDIRTLVIHPASTIYIHNTEEQKEAAGVYEDTIRVSVGIEDIQDLIQDFTEAVQAL